MGIKAKRGCTAYDGNGRRCCCCGRGAGWHVCAAGQEVERSGVVSLGQAAWMSGEPPVAFWTLAAGVRPPYLDPAWEARRFRLPMLCCGQP
jgi:hypothetical protein